MFDVSVIKQFDYFNCYKTCLEYDISAQAWESKKKLNDILRTYLIKVIFIPLIIHGRNIILKTKSKYGYYAQL